MKLSLSYYADENNILSDSSSLARVELKISMDWAAFSSEILWMDLGLIMMSIVDQVNYSMERFSVAKLKMFLCDSSVMDEIDEIVWILLMAGEISSHYSIKGKIVSWESSKIYLASAVHRSPTNKVIKPCHSSFGEADIRIEGALEVYSTIVLQFLCYG